MKKTKLFIATLLFCLLMTNAFAFNYTINFTGSGGSSTVESVIVQNLTKGTLVTVPAGNILNLNDVTTLVENINSTIESIRIYPNVYDKKFNLSFYVKQSGLFQINIFSVDGRKATSISAKLQVGNNSFQLSLPKGAFIVKVNGTGFNSSEKIINQSYTNFNPEILFSATDHSITAIQQKSKATGNITNMLYSTGDQLLYKGISGDFSTIIADVVTESKAINFEFVECKDADGNNYSVVKIGTQIWMAENLKTTKYNDGSSLTPIPIAQNNWIAPLGGCQMGGYSYSHYTDVTYRNTYGCYYNLFAIKNTKLAPVGWHVATDTEWIALSNYLGGNNISGGKLKSSTCWNTPSAGSTNSSGFSALPGGLCESGIFFSIGYAESWWCSTTFLGKKLGLRNYSNELFSDFSDSDECSGGKVRCVKD